MTAEADDVAATGSGVAPAPVVVGAYAIVEAEHRLEQAAPGYLDKVRAAAAALAVDGRRGAGVAAEVAAVREAAALDVEAPTASASTGGTLLKAGVKRLTGWYLRYLMIQVASFTSAVAAMSEALLARLDALDAADTRLASHVADGERRVEDLAARLAEIEHQLPERERGGIERERPGAEDERGVTDIGSRLADLESRLGDIGTRLADLDARVGRLGGARRPGVGAAGGAAPPLQP